PGVSDGKRHSIATRHGVRASLLLWIRGGRADHSRARHGAVGQRPGVRGEIPPSAIPRRRTPPPCDCEAVTRFTTIETPCPAGSFIVREASAVTASFLTGIGTAYGRTEG